MEQLSAFQMTMILAALIVASLNLVNGQISTPCTTSMISSFTPCANYITGSTNNGLIPSSTCCDSLRSLTSTSTDCACLVISANAPFFNLPINQALAVSLSQACNINNGVPLQCKASASPLPAPGPADLGSNGPSLPPFSASPVSLQQVSKTKVVAEAYKFENMQLARALAPASPLVEAEAPTKTPRIRPVLTPSSSASHPSYVSLSPFASIVMGIMVFGIY
ncbi:non-specific lipid transfer protein GPI-anchored 16-like [Gastrolobium bilobum]|uniref:non-specific lipid transfer protein GPI-anchored 16-like n=1 Tax=Gastrolobium bilobum TaxID=150636 RepID=UPI002AB1A615|nr:non-specific lipid transfer protein GPI-anchored 16-like [Gastrolobium bilobum]